MEGEPAKGSPPAAREAAAPVEPPPVAREAAAPVEPPPVAPPPPAPAPGPPAATAVLPDPRYPRPIQDSRRGEVALTTLAVAAVLSAIAFVAGGGQSLASTTRVEMALLLVGGLAVAATILLAPEGTRVRGGVALGLLVALAALAALSISWAVQPSNAWLEANRLFAYAAAFAAALALARIAPHRWPSVIGGVVLATTVVSGYALATKLFPEWLNEFELFARLREPFGYWNAVGLMGALAVPGCLWLGARREGDPLVSALAFPALGICLSATLMAYSRGALLAAGAGAIVWFVLVPLRLRGATVLIAGAAGAAMIAAWSFGQDALSTDRAALDDRSVAGHELLVLVLFVVAILYVVGLAAGFIADARPMRRGGRKRAGIVLVVALALTPVAAAGALATTDEGLGGSLDNAWTSLTDTSAVGPANDPSRLTATGSVRSRYWAEALEMWRDEPIAGLGAGGYATARPLYREDLLDVQHAHGYVPETMAELGLLGLAISIALLVAWIVAARTAILAAREPERAGLVTLAATAVVLGAHASIDWTWSIPATAVTGLLCAGWVAGRGPELARTAPRRALAARDPRRVVPALLVTALALFAAWTAWQPLRSSDASDEAITALDRGDVAAAREHAQTARDRNPLSVEPLFDLATIAHTSGDKDGAERALEEAARLQPANWVPWMRLTDYRLFEQQDPRGALDAVKVAVYLNPRSWDVAQRYFDVTRKLGGG
ncbi:MAG TPA: O-antigen ligase family protein [Solirubrobacteraceae bacterium]